MRVNPTEAAAICALCAILFHEPSSGSGAARVWRLARPRRQLRPGAGDFSGYAARVIRKAADGERELVTMNWGFILQQQQDRASRRVTYVRDDKIITSPFWKPSFAQRRCLVPASSYREAKGEKPATWLVRSAWR